jgi:hypothetical protein
MFIPDVEIIVGTYEEFLLGYKTVKKEEPVSWKKKILFKNYVRLRITVSLFSSNFRIVV